MTPRARPPATGASGAGAAPGSAAPPLERWLRAGSPTVAASPSSGSAGWSPLSAAGSWDSAPPHWLLRTPHPLVRSRGRAGTGSVSLASEGPLHLSAQARFVKSLVQSELAAGWAALWQAGVSLARTSLLSPAAGKPVPRSVGLQGRAGAGAAPLTAPWGEAGLGHYCADVGANPGSVLLAGPRFSFLSCPWPSERHLWGHR